MADTDAPAAPPAKRASKPKKAPKPKAPAAHPKYNEMITTAVGALNEKKGSSRQAILKYISANFKVGDNANVHLKLALKRMVETGTLKHVKGSGASGSFRLAEKPKAAKKPAKKAATPKSKKKPAAKKTAKPKAKPAAKKAAKKPAKKPAAKKAKKAAKPAAKKAKSPAKKSKAAPTRKTAKKSK